jgi:hypothetical protein
MQSEVDFLSEVKKLLNFHNIVSISGESGTGKTTLALQLIGSLLTHKQPYQDSCAWVQASELFSLKRLTQLFQSQEKKLDYIRDNIYIIPQKNLIRTYEEQTFLIQHILDLTIIMPPSIKYIIIDNISHHLRYKLSHYHSVKDISYLIDTFYENQLMPLILYCKRNEIILILIHEVTYSPKLERIKSFLHKLYDRINTIDLFLSHMYDSPKKNLQISFKNIKWNFQYTIKQNGIIISYI